MMIISEDHTRETFGLFPEADLTVNILRDTKEWTGKVEGNWSAMGHMDQERL